MWALKKKIFPKNVKALPSCKKNMNGQIITEPEIPEIPEIPVSGYIQEEVTTQTHYG